MHNEIYFFLKYFENEHFKVLKMDINLYLSTDNLGCNVNKSSVD